MTTQNWAEAKLDELLLRVEVTAGQLEERFPLYADTSTGEWTSTRRGSWTGGFWSGLLTLRAVATGSETDQTRAWLAWQRLQQWQDKDTSCRGLIFWYGSLGSKLKNTQGDLADAARVLGSAFEHELGLVPWGAAFGGVRESARVDGVAGLVPLLGWAALQDGSSELATTATSHLRRHLDLCIVDGSVKPSLVNTAEAGWHPSPSPGSGWSRGSAWLLLACVDAGLWLSADFAARAVRLAELWMRRFDAPIPPADADHPERAVDSSAAAIISVALLKLAELTGDRQWWKHGENMLRTLLDACLVPTGPARGAVAHGCYDLDSEVAIDHELVWGDFFCTLGLAVLTGLVEATDI
jgi:unsaturated chondroitin disaccharide hydrolase